MILTSIDFIIKELESLHNKFSNSNIRYEFCKSSNTHLLEVTPFEFGVKFKTRFPFISKISIKVTSLSEVKSRLTAELDGLG